MVINFGRVVKKVMNSLMIIPIKTNIVKKSTKPISLLVTGGKGQLGYKIFKMIRSQQMHFHIM